jgi:hypothetical protein
MRARRAGDWFDEVDALLIEPERRCDGIGRPNDIIDVFFRCRMHRWRSAQEKMLVMSSCVVLSR